MSAATPTVSIVTPVFDPDPAHLTQCLDSVRRQTTGALEHVLVDDGSTRAGVADVLHRAAAGPDVTVVRRTDRGGIVAATNDALGVARGEFVAFLDHDDLLHPEAIEKMVAATTRSSTRSVGAPGAPVDVVYSDHDFVDADGDHLGACLKPQWSPERLRNQNYVTHFVIARRSLVAELGGLRDGLDGAQDHDLMLRMGEQARRIVHVPEVLYHWRQAPSSVSAGTDAKPWAFDAGVRAVAEHCGRIGLDARVLPTGNEGIYRIHRTTPSPDPLVSVLVPTRGSSGTVWGVTRCFVYEAIRSIVERSDYQHLEFVVIVDDDTPRSVITALHDLLGPRLRLVGFHEEFNFAAKMNRGAHEARGDLLLFLNDDTELIEPESIRTLVGLVSGPAEGLDGTAGAVGMAGAKLLFDDGTVQHGGHVYAQGPHHALTGRSGVSPGPAPLKPLAVERECSGVTAAVAMVSRAVFEEVDGFAEALPNNYNDVDFSLRLRRAGYRIVWTPYSLWYHFESRTRIGAVTPVETAYLAEHWADVIDDDPYYHPKLAPQRFDWVVWPVEEPMRMGIEFDPEKVWRFRERHPSATRGTVFRSRLAAAGRRLRDTLHPQPTSVAMRDESTTGSHLSSQDDSAHDG